MTPLVLSDAEATEAFGRQLAGLLRRGDVIALYGPLGAGKTTLARGIVSGLGHDGEVSSPTFPIVLPYETAEIRLPVWHVDLYRIEHPSELAELGLEEARSECALIIEWPERMPHLWHDALRLTLEPRLDGSRALTASVPEAWAGRWRQ